MQECNHTVKLGDAVAQLAQRAADRGRVEDRRWCRRAPRTPWHRRARAAPHSTSGVRQDPTGRSAAPKGLADAGRAEAESDVAVLAHGIGEFGKTSVFLRRDKGAHPLAVVTDRRPHRDAAVAGPAATPVAEARLGSTAGRVRQEVGDLARVR